MRWNTAFWRAMMRIAALLMAMAMAIAGPMFYVPADDRDRGAAREARDGGAPRVGRAERERAPRATSPAPAPAAAATARGVGEFEQVRRAQDGQGVPAALVYAVVAVALLGGGVLVGMRAQRAIERRRAERLEMERWRAARERDRATELARAAAAPRRAAAHTGAVYPPRE
jgi:hypothetical protein